MEMLSDESLDLNPEQNTYMRKFLLLLKKCEIFQNENEQIVYRINYVNRARRRVERQVKFLKKRLDRHGDSYETITIDDESAVGKETRKDDPPIETPGTVSDKPKKTPKRSTKRKAKGDRDKNAPKRPANPFFQFCQEQRHVLMGQLNADLKPGESEPSKQELTRQLAIKWKSLSTQDKKIYIDRYERSKEKYAEEMSAYNCKT